MHLPNLDARSRVMMFAPHPDDESLAAGVFLQQADAAGADIRLVYATNGEKNCWPQRLLERKIRLRSRDRRRWGMRRQKEAIAALRLLNIGHNQVEFLSLPDQGLTDLLLQDSGELIRHFAAIIDAWQPTILLVPSAFDTHPDHSSLALFLRLACDRLSPAAQPISRLEYLVHGRSDVFALAALSLPQTHAEAATKKGAIVCHASQVTLSRRRFLAYAKRPERFLRRQENLTLALTGPVHSFCRERHALHLQIAFSATASRAKETSLYLLGPSISGELCRLRAVLPYHNARLELIDCGTGGNSGFGHYEGNAFRAEIFLPLSKFDPNEAVFLKFDRRLWFFDEAGWLEIGAIPARTLSRSISAPALAVA